MSSTISDPIKVLHIDDEEDLLHVTKLYLEKKFNKLFSVKSLINPKKAIGVIRDEEFDLIISDYQMSEINGIELYENIRNAGIDIPFIIFTGKGREEVAIQAINAGIDRYIKKGIDIESQFLELKHIAEYLVNHYRTKANLVKSEKRLKLALNTSNVSFYEYQTDMKDGYVSEKFAEMLGYSHNELPPIDQLTDWVFGKIHPEDSPAIYQNMQDFIKGEDTEPYVYFRMKHRNGNWIYLKAKNSAMEYDSEGKIKRLIGTGTEITEQRKLEEEILRQKNELEEKNTLFNALFQSIPDVLLKIHKNGKIISYFANEANLFISEENFLGKHLSSILPGELGEQALNAIKKVVSLKKLRTFEYDLEIDGKIKSFESRMAPFEEEYVLSITRETTKMKNLQKELERKSEELSDAVHSIRHDINNSFTIINGYLELFDIEFNKTYSEKIQKQIEISVDILNRSVELADAGLIVEKKEKVDLNSIIENIRLASVPKEINVQSENLPYIFGDNQKIAQVFKNIIENAVTHGNPNNITIKMKKNKNRYKLLLENDGKMIPESLLEKIFLKGFSTGNGRGYGLNIAKIIIEALNWRLEVKSNREITSFQISLPNKDIISE